MKITAISNGVYAARTQVSPKTAQHNKVVYSRPQNVSFQGTGLKIGLGIAGGILGGLIIGGPVGAIIGAAAGIKGAQIAEEEDEE